MHCVLYRWDHDVDLAAFDADALTCLETHVYPTLDRLYGRSVWASHAHGFLERETGAPELYSDPFHNKDLHCYFNGAMSKGFSSLVSLIRVGRMPCREAVSKKTLEPICHPPNTPLL